MVGRIDLPKQHVKAFIRFHTFTGNDCAIIFYKGKTQKEKVITDYGRVQEYEAQMTIEVMENIELS